MSVLFCIMILSIRKGTVFYVSKYKRGILRRVHILIGKNVVFLINILLPKAPLVAIFDKG